MLIILIIDLRNTFFKKAEWQEMATYKLCDLSKSNLIYVSQSDSTAITNMNVGYKEKINVLPALQSLTKKKCITQWKFLLHCFSPPNL
jgi:hypothetical protein